jgi:hypothetical protein
VSKIIRTPTRAEGGITPEEKARMDVIAQKWINVAMRTEPIEPNKIIPAVHALYEAAGLKKPRVVIVPSPLVMAFAYGAAAWIWHCRKQDKSLKATDAATRAATVDATVDATYAATDAATYAATVDATDAATYAATYAATDVATRAATDAATDAEKIGRLSPEEQVIKACRELAGIGGILCAARWYGPYQGGNMWAAWTGFLEAARSLPTPDIWHAMAIADRAHRALHGGFRVLHEEFCIVSDFPAEIHKDEQNRPHSEFGPSHRWRDGWELYHWHGVKVPKEWITEKRITAAEALRWPNMEQRRAACEIIGWAKVLEELAAKVIDTDEDAEIGQLLEAEIPDSGPERFLKVRCGTGRTFVLSVPRECKTALAANAWTYGLDAMSFKPEVRT